MSNRIPADKINLRLILVSGKTKEFLFSPNDSAAEIAQHVFDNWPDALQLPLGKTTVMHLVPRENLPEPNSQDQRQKSKERSSGCCSASCSIL
uniref:Putative ubiquitin-like protein 3-like isoform 2 apis mellifera n=1 Tax=Ixodes ricinus TaxID=34613 RepID=V5I0N1_IXORI